MPFTSTDRRLDVVLVAPSLRILGGQAVQADRLLRAWQGDPTVHARLVPVNPIPPGLFRHMVKVKYVRTIVTQICYWPSLVRQLRQADIVHVFSASYFSFLLATLPAVLVARLLGKPVVLNYHSGEAPDHLRRSAITRATLRSVERNAVPSGFLKDVFAEYGISAEAIPNIVDTERFRYRERRVLRPNILSTRNFEEPYNVACTLHAFRLVQDVYPDATLTLVGSGSQMSRLEALRSELHLDHVRFVGRVAPDHIWRYYAEADIYLQTPNIDNMPLSVLEAFASGCAVVSTNVGGVPAILTNEMHGLLVPCGDYQAAAHSILRLVREPGLAARLTTRARETCEAYRWRTVRAQWLALYKGLAAPQAMRERPASAV